MDHKEELEKINEIIEYINASQNTDLDSRYKFLSYLQDIQRVLNAEFTKNLVNNDYFKEEHNNLMGAMKKFRKSLAISLSNGIITMLNKAEFCKSMIKKEELREAYKESEEWNDK